MSTYNYLEISAWIIGLTGLTALELWNRRQKEAAIESLVNIMYQDKWWMTMMEKRIQNLEEKLVEKEEA